MKRIAPILFAFALPLLFTACGGKAGDDLNPEIAQSVAATQTKMAWEASVEDARQAENAGAAAEESETTPEPEIVHEMVPESTHKELANTYLTDFNSIDYADEGITYGDQFFMNRYERPFTVEMEEYRSYLDIILSEMFVTPPWIYVDVYFSEDLPANNSAMYSLELDLDVDGRGDFLIQAPLPSSSEWTVEGVTVLEDSNEDVGGENPQLTDPPSGDLLGDGFDLVVFDSGVGDDPDLAWIRRNPEDPTMLQFAFKSDLTGNTGFLWSVWADEGLKDPGMRDYNDRFTFEQAGSPYPEHQFYPIQEVNLLDSTCRSWYGFEPEGSEIGICQVYIKEGPDKGFKLCYRVTDTVYVCSDVCSPRCPANLPSRWFCESCNLPRE